MPLADDPLYGPKPKPQPTQPKPAPYKAPPNSGTVNSNTGSRAYAGRNPALTQNPNRTPTYYRPASSAILPYKSRLAHTQKLTNTAAQLLDAPHLVNYWLNDIVSYKKEVMQDRKDLAQEQYQNEVQEYDRKFDAALSDGRFNWITNNPDPELTPDAWKKNVDRKTPIDYKAINKRLEEFIQNLQGADRSDYYSPNSPYNLSLNFDRGLESKLEKLDSRRESQNTATLAAEENANALRLAMKKAEEEGTDMASRVAAAKFFTSPVGTALTPENDTESEWGDALRGGIQKGIENVQEGVKNPHNPLLDPIQNMGYAALEELRPKTPIEMLQNFARGPFEASEGKDEKGLFGKTVDMLGPLAGPLAGPTSSALDATNDFLGNPADKALDWLSRPLNAAVNAYDETFAANEDEESSTLADVLKWTPMLQPLKPIEWLTGANPVDSVDEFVTNPSTLGDVAQGAGEGFTNEYDGGFAKVIANQAERDSEKNIYDSERYQRWAGLGLDLVADPINFVGVGLVTKPYGIARGAVTPSRLEAKLGQAAVGPDEATRRLGNELWSEYSKIPESQRIANAPRNVNEMMSIVDGTRANGYRPKTFRTMNERKVYQDKAKADLDLLAMELSSNGFTTSEKLSSLKGLRETTAAVREAHKLEAGDWGYLDYLEEVFKVKVDKGDMSPQALQELKTQMVTVPVISRALQNVSRNADNKSVYDALGEKWAYGSGLTKDETDNIAKNVFGYLANKDETFINMTKRIGIVKAEQTKLYKAGRKEQAKTAGYKIQRLYDRRRMYQAAMLHSAFEAKRAGKVGDVKGMYNNPERTDTLMKLRDEAQKRLEQSPVAYTNTTADRARVDNDTAWNGPGTYFKDNGDELLEGDMRGGYIRDTDMDTGAEKIGSTPAMGMGEQVGREFENAISFGDEVDLYKYLEPDFKYPDSHAHYEALIKSIDKELKSERVLSGAYGINKLPDPLESKMNLAKIPDEIRHLDSYEIVTTMLQFDGIDNFSMKQADTFSPEVRQWGESLANLMNDKFAEKYLHEQGKIVRRSREQYVMSKMESTWKQYAGVYDFKSGMPLPGSKGILPSKKNRQLMAQDLKTFGRDAEKKFGNQNISTAKVHELRRQASIDVLEEVKAALRAGELNSLGLIEKQFPLDRVIGTHTSPDEIMDLLETQFIGQREQLEAAKAKVQAGLDKNAPFHEAKKELDHLNQQIADLDNQIKELKAADKEARKRKKAVADEYSKRAMEHMYLTTAMRAVKEDPKFFTLQAMGSDLLRIPTLGTLLRNIDTPETLAKNIDKFKQAYNNSFAAPSKMYGEAADLWRNRVTHSSRRIQINLEELKNSVGQYSKEQRVEAFRAYVTGDVGAYRGGMAQYEAIEKAFEPIVNAFKNPEKLGDFYIDKHDINHFLNDHYKLDLPQGTKINSASDIVNAMMRHAEKAGRKNTSDLYKDPVEVAWALRLGLEQARSQRSFMQGLAETFGTPYKAVPVGAKGGPYADAMQALKKEAGWRSVDTLGRDRYLFPPEAADLAEKMFKSLDPRTMGPDRIENFVKMTDQVISAWKASVTIYNPSYWVKNGIGEIYTSWLFGVRNPQSYKQAMQLVKHAKGSERELQALQSLTPMASHMAKKNRPSKIMMKRRKGKETITYDDMLVAYHDEGLKTGFFDNDLKHNLTPTRQAMEDHGGSLGRGALKVHDFARAKGEGYEDMLRMAHFIDYIKRSNKPFAEAVKDAAQEVRKAHFDYDDFNDFEKTVMLRAFPFYKWTRKAAPMYMEMLFLKPGKVIAPFKVANTTSNEITSTDMTEDPNGYMPNFSGMAPQFVRDMWAYQMDEGELDSYANPPIPSMDLFRALSQPAGLAKGMTNPLVKLPTTMIFDDEKSGGENLLEGLSPQTKWIDRANDKQGYTWQDWVTMMGMPTYQENEAPKGVNFNGGRP